MEHATALVDHDATTPVICGCQRLVDVGWTVRCNACGRGLGRLAVAELQGAGTPAAELLTLVYNPGDHICVGCEACMDDVATDEANFESRIDAYDEAVEAGLVDAAERRVA